MRALSQQALNAWRRLKIIRSRLRTLSRASLEARAWANPETYGLPRTTELSSVEAQLRYPRR